MQRALLFSALFALGAGFGACLAIFGRAPVTPSAPSACVEPLLLREELATLERRLDQRIAASLARAHDGRAASVATSATSTPVAPARAEQASHHDLDDERVTGAGPAMPSEAAIASARSASEATVHAAFARGSWTEADREALRASWDALPERERQAYFGQIAAGIAEGTLTSQLRGPVL
jgi:hypothetical protein